MLLFFNRIHKQLYTPCLEPLKTALCFCLTGIQDVEIINVSDESVFKKNLEPIALVFLTQFFLTYDTDSHNQNIHYSGLREKLKWNFIVHSELFYQRIFPWKLSLRTCAYKTEHLLTFPIFNPPISLYRHQFYLHINKKFLLQFLKNIHFNPLKCASIRLHYLKVMFPVRKIITEQRKFCNG